MCDSPVAFGLLGQCKLSLFVGAEPMSMMHRLQVIIRQSWLPEPFLPQHPQAHF